ncbi:MAG TPA: ScpA family protein [Dongiaceae bacterium]
MNEAGGFTVDLDGFEGPLDLLLSLAREQKVDLARISILALVEQYLTFIHERARANLELAADYLVMAAWLAYLKSRLLLPEPPSEDEPSAEEMAANLAFQLQRLEAMRKAGAALLARPQLLRDRFARGEPEETRTELKPWWKVTLYELLRAYGDVLARKPVTRMEIEAPDLFSPDDAIRRLEAMLGKMPRWSTLSSFLPPGISGLLLRSAMAAHLVGALELCKQGRIELRQDPGLFTPLWVKAREGGPVEQ